MHGRRSKNYCAAAHFVNYLVRICVAGILLSHEMFITPAMGGAGLRFGPPERGVRLAGVLAAIRSVAPRPRKPAPMTGEASLKNRQVS